jgi:HPt (histidine-containing phosphotransfer) domain-containing protein
MINWEKFNEYVGWQEPYQLIELIRDFLDRHPENMVHLAKGITDRNFDTVDKLAHDIKVHCGMFGAVKAAELALSLEIMGKSCQDNDMDLVYAKFQQENDAMVAELEQYCLTAGT